MDAIAIEALHALTRTEPAEQERQSTWIKLEPTVNTANDEKLAQAASALRRNRCK